MAHRIEVVPTTPDTRAQVRTRSLQALGFPVEDVQLVDTYTIDTALSEEQLKEVAHLFANPLIQRVGKELPLEGDGLSLFKNGVRYFQ